MYFSILHKSPLKYDSFLNRVTNGQFQISWISCKDNVAVAVTVFVSTKHDEQIEPAKQHNTCQQRKINAKFFFFLQFWHKPLFFFRGVFPLTNDFLIDGSVLQMLFSSTAMKYNTDSPNSGRDSCDGTNSPKDQKCCDLSMLSVFNFVM